MRNIGCPVCANPLTIRTAKGRKSNKPFIMFKCPIDGRHFRGFITDGDYIKRVLQDQLSLETSKNGLDEGRGMGLSAGGHRDTVQSIDTGG